MGNFLLDALPREIYRTLERHFERVAIKRGETLHEPGQPIRHLYFPLTCLLSVTITGREGKTVETGIAGNREMLGVNAFMGGWDTNRYVVQIPGDAGSRASRIVTGSQRSPASVIAS